MKQKNYSLEIVRMISFIMVIAIHTANYYCRAYGSISTGEYLFSLIINTVSRVSVPCFFMLSGALLLGHMDSIKKSLNRAKSMFGKLFFWSIMYYLFNTYITHQDTFTWSNFLIKPAEAHLWYLYVLIPIYIMLPFLQVLSNGLNEKLAKAFVMIGFLWLIGLYVLSFWKKGFYYDLPLLGDRSYLFYFFAGHLIQKYKEQIRLKFKHCLALSVICILIVFAATAAVTLAGHAHYEKFLNYGNPFIVLASVCFFAVFLCINPEKLKLTEKAKSIIDQWSACSFGIYIVHLFFLDLYKINFSPSAFSAYIIVPILILGLAVCSFLFVKLLRYFTVGKKLL